MMVNPGFEAGIAKREQKEKLGWALKGAEKLRKKDMPLTVLQAVSEGRRLRTSITQKLEKVGVDPGEGLVYAVFAKPDMSAVGTNIIDLTPEKDLEIAQVRSASVPIGYLVFVWDKEWEEKVFGHARPLIVSDARAIALNEQALKTKTNEIRETLKKAGVVRGDSN